MAVIKTNMGDITISLDREKAPVTVENFEQYAKDGHFDGTVFHRVIKGFMVQGGGMSSDMKQKKNRAPIKNESSNGLTNKKYTLAMARTSVPDSATSQFFINTGENKFLDKAQAQDGFGYAVFGTVTDGFDIVDSIENVKTGNKSGHSDVPVETVEIVSIELDS